MKTKYNSYFAVNYIPRMHRNHIEYCYILRMKRLIETVRQKFDDMTLNHSTEIENLTN